MEAWAIVALVIGLNITTVVSSYFLAKMQVSHSDKRFERGLERAKETDEQQRRREIRSEPLRKLGAELARMAAKRDRSLAAREGRLASVDKQRKRTPLDMTKEDAARELQEAENDWNAYRASGDLAQILFLQYDKELVNKVEEVRRDSWLSFIDARKVRERNKARVIEVQELINKRLEEL